MVVRNLNRLKQIKGMGQDQAGLLRGISVVVMLLGLRKGKSQDRQGTQTLISAHVAVCCILVPLSLKTGLIVSIVCLWAEANPRFLSFYDYSHPGGGLSLSSNSESREGTSPAWLGVL